MSASGAAPASAPPGEDPLGGLHLPAAPLAASPAPGAAGAPVGEKGGLIPRTDKALGRRQLGAMLRKNYLVKKRAWCQTLCECLAPLILTLLILVGWQLSSNSATSTPPTVYVNNSLDLGGLLVNASDLIALVDLAGLANGSAPEIAPPDGREPTTPGGLTSGALGDLIRGLTNHTGPLPVPNLDTFIRVHDVLHSYLLSGQGNALRAANRLSLADSRFNVLANLGKLSFAPDTPEVRALVAKLNATYATFASALDKVYPTEQAAIDYALRDFTLDPGFSQRDPYALRSWAVLVFHEFDLDQGRVDYGIRMNYSVVPSTKRTSLRFPRGYDDTYTRYYLSGYLSIQLAVEQAIVALAEERGIIVPPTSVGANTSAVRASFGELLTAPMPIQSTYSNPFYDSSGPFVGLVLCMSLLFPVSRLIKNLVEDKESRMKETLKMMGLLNWVFVTSYGITYFIIFTAIAILQTILMCASVLSYSSPALVFFFFWLFGLSMMCLGFLISVFFSRSKLAGIVGPIACLALVMPRYAFLTTEDDEQLGAKWFCCIFSPTAYAFAMDVFMSYEGAQRGVTPSNASDEPLSVTAMLTFMFFDGVAYALLAWFLEQTLPNEYGSNRPPWFLCTREYWGRTKPERAGEDSEAGAGPYSELDSSRDPMAVHAALEARAEEEARLGGGGGGVGAPPSHIEPIRSSELKPRVFISHLNKVFHHGNSLVYLLRRGVARLFQGKNEGGKAVKRDRAELVAVRDLTLTMYEGQITCLLGHNGAGKTTTISMLTGLYSPTSGDAFLHGYSIRHQMSSIRRHLGICPQHNVLFDTLTVREHLELLAVLKGTPAALISRAVEDKIAEVGLSAKSDTYSAALSGGMKRKLSVGMALIGDSKVVFLDEPTSGMDPYSRRSTWDLLKRAKVGRVIVLTTHFMDEADLLGDRIAILANGVLRACGSSLFLKNQFGIGYSLTLVYKRNVKPPLSPGAGIQQQVQQENGSAVAREGAGGSSPLHEPLLAGERGEHVPASPVQVAWSQERVLSFIRSFVPSAQALSQAAGEISFQLPLSSVSNFAALFDALEERKDDMGVANYGVSMTRLEEVFLRLAEETETFKIGREYLLDDKDGAAGGAAQSQQQQQGAGAPGVMVLVSPAPVHATAVAVGGHSGSNSSSGGSGGGGVAQEGDVELAEIRSASAGSDSAGTAAEPQQQSHLAPPEPGLSSRIASPSDLGADVAASALAPAAPSASPPAPTTPSVSPPLNERVMSASAEPLMSATSSPALAAVGAGAAAAGAQPSGLVGDDLISGGRGEKHRSVAAFPVQVRELVRKRYLCAKRDLMGRLYEVVLPVVIVALVLLILTISFSPAGPSMTMSSSLYQKGARWADPLQADVQTGGGATSQSLAEQVLQKLHSLRSGGTGAGVAAGAGRASSSHSTLSLAAGDPTSSVLYYPSYALSSNLSLPDNSDFGLTPIPLTGVPGALDNGLLYQLGLTTPSPADDDDELPPQPFVLQYYPNTPNSLNLSLELLEDVLAHRGARVGSYVFGDDIRVVRAVEAEQARVVLAAVLEAQGVLPPGSNLTVPTVTIPIPLPLQQLDLNDALTLLGVDSLAALAPGAGFNASGVTLPGVNGTLSVSINDGGDLLVSLPTLPGLAGFTLPVSFNISLESLVSNATTRIPGTDTFVFRGVNLTLPAEFAPPPGVDSLNYTQLLQALQNTYVNTTATLPIPTSITLPLSALVDGVSDATVVALVEGILQTYGLGAQIAPVTLMHNVSMWHAIPAFAADLFAAKFALLYDEAARALPASAPLEEFARVSPAWSPSRAQYTVRNHPLPLTTQTVLQIRAILAIFAALFVLIPFCYLPASFVIFVVKERSSKAKHLQLVSGVSPTAYWTSTFAFDAINYALVCVAVIVVFLAYQNESFTGDSATTFATFLLFLLYGLAVVPLAYCLSFMFTNHTAAQVGISALLFVLGFVLTIGSFILSNIDDTKDTNEALKPFYRLSPPYCLGEGLIALATRALYGLIAGRKQSVWDWDILGRIFVYLAVECIGYFVITMLIELQVLKKGWRGLVNRYQAWAESSAAASAAAAPASSAEDQAAHASQSRRRIMDGVPLEGANEFPVVGANATGGAASTREEALFQSRNGAASSGSNGVAEGAAPGEGSASNGRAHALASHPSSSRTLAAVARDASQADGPVPAALEDDDVAFERRRVESGQALAEKDLIVLRHLRKEFGWDGRVRLPWFGGRNLEFRLPKFLRGSSMVAVKDLSLSVPAGQCFGFLGINGAGKTTTMSMLTGEIDPSDGRGWLGGYDVVTERELVRQELGFCPQFDPLLADMTAREHLELYGRVRGIPDERLNPLVEHLITKLGLTPFADNVSDTYSGGNKRKLSLALALIGDPSVVFLDEPSTGMDPVSRRFMWGVIAELSQRMSVVLTTHSMEECEALCSRVGIMVNGQLACLGSLEHLKHKFGRGYFVEIATDEHRVEDVRRFVQELFQGAEEQEHHSGRLQYLIPRQTGAGGGEGGGLTLASIFRRIESRKHDLSIHDYGVSQASLESIFVNIAKSQDQAQAEARANHNDAREAKLR